MRSAAYGRSQGPQQRVELAVRELPLGVGVSRFALEVAPTPRAGARREDCDGQLLFLARQEARGWAPLHNKRPRER